MLIEESGGCAVQEGASVFVISGMQGLLVSVALACCVGCLWMVFFFGRQIQTSAYVRDSLVAAVKAEELQNLMRVLQTQRLAGPLDEKNPPPKGFEREARALWEDDRLRAVAAPDRGPSIPYNATPEQTMEIKESYRREREASEREKKEKREPFEKWAIAERERYAVLRQSAEETALKNAESRVPKTMDISLLGGGWSFLLEFSTVIVIIFILLCLGILNAVTGRDSITILASIAGYVLGKASASTLRGQSPEQSVKVSPTQAVAPVQKS